MDVSTTNAGLVKKIAGYSVQYRRMAFENVDRSSIEAHPLRALEFFFSRVCFQGRRDDLSARVFYAAMEVLNSEFGDEDFRARYLTNAAQNWVSVMRELEVKIGKGKVGKAGDIKMITSTLAFIGRLPDLNVVSYSLRELRSGRVEQHYRELQGSQSANGIYQVGPKVAALYLRDLVSLYSLEDQIPDESAFCLQPVDVWVRKVAKRVGLSSELDDHQIQIEMARLCRRNAISPLRFNQGAWYVGYNSFDILLSVLGSQDEVTVPESVG